MSNQALPNLRKAWPLALLVLMAATLGGCLNNVAELPCKHVAGNTIQVAENAKCRFRVSRNDMAKYTVAVTRAPIYGEAKARGSYLLYAAKPGYRGEDKVSIRVERRGVGGNTQWQTYTLTIKVGTKA